MSSDGPALPAAPVAPVVGTPSPETDSAEALARQIERLANELFATPAPVAPQTLPGAPAPVAPPAVGPNALAMGAGGASPAVTLPPIPGAIKQPPVTTAPAPKESD